MAPYVHVHFASHKFLLLIVENIDVVATRLVKGNFFCNPWAFLVSYLDGSMIDLFLAVQQIQIKMHVIELLCGRQL